MSLDKFKKALFELLPNPKEKQQNKKPTTPTPVPEPLFQLRNQPEDNNRGDQYLPQKGDSGRAVKPVFSTTTSYHSKF